MRIEAGAGDGPLMTLTADGCRLHPKLLGPEMMHPQDADWQEQQDASVAGLALDRWRRSTGLVLEAVELHELARELGVEPTELPLEWWSLGLAAEGVDRELPDLGWLWPEAVDLLTHPEKGLDDTPRKGAWFFRWLHLEARPLPELSLDGIQIDMETWMDFGRWCRNRGRGPASLSPLPIPRAPHIHRVQPWAAPALSLHPVLLRAGAAGLKPVCEGGELSPNQPLRAEEEVAALVGVLEAGTVNIRDQHAGPEGNWVLLSGGLGANIGSGRGVEMQLYSDGRVLFVMANAFLGLMEGRILSLAEKFGVSGEAPGRWRVLEMSEDGQTGTMLIEGLDPSGLSVHPRASALFALPAKTWMEPVRKALTQLEDQPLRFSLDPDLEGVELLVEAEIRENQAELRFCRASPEPEDDS
jgi:hypothetical protein